MNKSYVTHTYTLAVKEEKMYFLSKVSIILQDHIQGDLFRK
jgi:hypothetical protein